MYSSAFVFWLVRPGSDAAGRRGATAAAIMIASRDPKHPDDSWPPNNALQPTHSGAARRVAERECSADMMKKPAVRERAQDE